MKFILNYAAIGLAAALATAGGCTQAPPPEFHLNMVQAATNEIDPAYQQEIANVLGAMFGTPDDPHVLAESGLDQKLLTLAAGPAWTDSDSQSHGLYRRHCVHCHGISGDGRGPTALFLDPYPRDYRKGVFKFKSTYASAKPSDADLVRILHNGIPGTSMPSFSLLPRPEVDALVEYVKYLAIRGEMETALVNYVAQELGEEEAEDANGEPILEDGEPKMIRLALNPAENPEQGDVIKESLAMIVEAWDAAAENAIVPEEGAIPEDNRSAEEFAKSAKAGRELFLSKKANCYTCHGPTALGDGQQTDYDVWMKDIVAAVTLAGSTEKANESLAEVPEDETDEQEAEREAGIERNDGLISTLEDALSATYPIRNAIPRNLRQGVYRGGRRRVDVFYRIHAGIPGSPMPGVGSTAPGGQGTLTEAEIWQLVDYVMSLPYEAASGPDQDLQVNQLPVVR
jgi:mono/diheme cytochrome c family protein